MTTFELFGTFDPARILGIGKNYVDQNKQSQTKIVRTYDAYRDVVQFVYPEIRTSTTECQDTFNDAMQALHSDKFAMLRGNLDIKTDGEYFEILMSRWNFEQIFATQLALRLHNPGNIVAKYAPLATGKNELTAYVTPSKQTVTLLYENIYTPESKQYTESALRKSLPQSAKDNVEFFEYNKSLAITFPVRVYESLTGHRVPLVRAVEKNQF